MKKIILTVLISICAFLIVKPELVFSQNNNLYTSPYFKYSGYKNSSSVNQYNSYNVKPIANYKPQNTAQSNNNGENILIILDSSESMSDKIGDMTKMDIAKRTINNVLAKVSPNKKIGLRVYGHKSGMFSASACKASELMVPIGSNNISRIKSVVNSMKPTGMTPMTYSLQQAIAYDLNGLPGKKRIILVSDGAETCDGSPCDYIVDLVKQGSDLKIDTVGFALDDPDAVSQLKCVALSTKAHFYTAKNANELEKSLIKSLNVSTEVYGKVILK